MSQEIVTTIAEHLADAAHGWSIGTYGAIAEFMRRGTEPILRQNLAPTEGPLLLALPQGAVRLELASALTPVAYETLSRNPEYWSHGVAFCLETTKARLSERDALTELGPDGGAILERDRDAMLFDMGLNVAHIDVCIRTADAGLINTLRKYCGQSLLDEHSAAMKTVIAHSPHRVFFSRLGRIEIYQAIGQTQTPQGPHTHVLPRLLACGKSHGDEIPIPKGMHPCLTLHPASPLVDWLGRPKPFEARGHRRFQALLDLWGDTDYVQEKRRVARALAAGIEPSQYAAPKTELGWVGLRIALRQQRKLEGSDPLLQRWRTAYDAVDGAA